MMYTVSVTSQGQLSIPAKMRKQHGIAVSSKVLLESTPAGITIRPPVDLESLMGSIKTTKKIPFWKTRKAFEEALGRGEV